MGKLLRKMSGALAMGAVWAAVLQAAGGQGGELAKLAALGCEPAAAAGALRSRMQSGQALYAQTQNEDDLASGFWTELPTAAELLPAPPAPSFAPGAPPADAPAAPARPEGALPVAEAHYGPGSGERYIACGAGTIKNCTALPAAEVAAEVGQPLPFDIQPNSPEPQVLIMHTHATETYQPDEQPWYDPSFAARTTDTARNMAAVGAEIAARLNAAGINTVQDTTLHDYPSYTGSYERSNATVRRWLEEYPSIKVVLDVHRDAIEYEDGTRVKPVADIAGMKAAQVMLICGADKNGNLPNFRQNLRFAAAWQAKMERMYPGLTRPVLFDHRYYNQDLTTGSLLIEMGGHANTLEEAKYSARLVGNALAALLTGQ